MGKPGYSQKFSRVQKNVRVRVRPKVRESTESESESESAPLEKIPTYLVLNSKILYYIKYVIQNDIMSSVYVKIMHYIKCLFNKMPFHLVQIAKNVILSSA